MPDGQDTEVTLGTGRLLALFFGLVVICALFFSLGFSLGRKSAGETAGSTTAAAAPSPATTAPNKPSTAKDAKADCPNPDGCGQQQNSPAEMTFYKAVEQKDANAELQPAAKESPEPSRTERPPELTSSNGSSYMVQVAAVSKQEDAEALVSALRKKQYPVFTATASGDKLFHVQVGPFADIRDAEAMKAKLVGDGYNPIVKR